MDIYTVPTKIKNKIRANYLTTIIGGLIICIGSLLFERFGLGKMVSSSDTSVFSNAFYLVIICALIFLIIIPLVFLFTKKDEKDIISLMKKFDITEKVLSFDYDKSVSVSKMRIGERCSYYKSFYFFKVLPHEDVAWVYLKTTIKKDKKVARNLDGTVRHEKYTMSENYRYSVVFRTLTKKTVQVHCDKQKTAHDIIDHFSKIDHILIGEGKEQKKEYSRMLNAYKKGIKDYDKAEGDGPQIRT